MHVTDVELTNTTFVQDWLQTNTETLLKNSKPKSEPSMVITVPPMDDNSKGLINCTDGPRNVTTPKTI